MVKPGRPKKHVVPDKAAIPGEVVVSKTETPELPDAPLDEGDDIVKDRPEEVAEQTCWRYHRDIPPRKFLKGETIPTGWTNDAAVRRLWACDPFGKFIKVEVKP